MIEMHLDPTPAIDFFSFDSVGVLADQKAGESDDGLFIGEKCVFGRPPGWEIPSARHRSECPDRD